MANPAKLINVDHDYNNASLPINLPDPVNNGDATNKSWVLSQIATAVAAVAQPFTDAAALVKNSADNTKLLKVSAASITTGTTRTWYAPDSDQYVTGFAALPSANRLPYTNSNGTLGQSANATLDSSGNITSTAQVQAAYFLAKAPVSGLNDLYGFVSSVGTTYFTLGLDASNQLYVWDAVNNKYIVTFVPGATYTEVKLNTNTTLVWNANTTLGLSNSSLGSNRLEVNRGKKYANSGTLADIHVRYYYLLGGAANASAATLYYQIAGTPTGARVVSLPDMTATLLGTAGLTAGRLPYAVAIDAGVGLADSANATLDSSGNLTSAGTVTAAYNATKGVLSAARQDLHGFLDSGAVYRWAIGLDASNNLYFNDQANNKDVLTLLLGATYTTVRLPASGTLSFNGSTSTIGLASSATISNALEVNRGKIYANAGGMGSVIARDYYFTGSTSNTPYGQITGTLTGNRVYTFPDASLTIVGSSSALTSGRVPFATTGGVLTDSGAVTYNAATTSGNAQFTISSVESSLIITGSGGATGRGWQLVSGGNAGFGSGYFVIYNASAGGDPIAIRYDNRVSINNRNLMTAQLNVTPDAAGTTGLLVQLAASATASAFQVTNSGATVVYDVNKGGMLTIGTASTNLDRAIWVKSPGFDTSTVLYGIYQDWTIPTTATAQVYGITSRATLSANAYTVSGYYNFFAAAPSLGAGSAITTVYGLYIAKQKQTGVTTGYGVYQVDSADLNYFAGNVAIGSTGYLATVPFSVVKSNASNFAAYVGNTSSSASTSYGLLIDAGTSATDQPFKIRDYSGTTILHTVNGYGATSIFLAAASAIGLLIKAAASHTADLQQWIDSSSTAQLFVRAEAKSLTWASSGTIRGVASNELDFNDAGNTTTYALWKLQSAGYLQLRGDWFLNFAGSTSNATTTADLGLYRNGAGVLEINNGTAGTYRDLKLRDLTSTRSILFGPNSREPITIDTGAFPATTITINVDAQSVYWYNTSAAANTFAVDLKATTTGMDTLLSTGQQLTTLLCIKQGASGASYYATSIKVEGTTTGVTTIWVGGAPSAGNANGTDVYQFTIVKTASATYTVFASLVQYK